MSILVLHGNNPGDIRTWDELVSRAPTPDVYYRPAYVRAYGLTGHGRPLALMIRSGEAEALFPVLVRQFEVNGETFRDAVTAYGYGGLLQFSPVSEPDPGVLRSIIGQLREWTRASGLVACTIRFHPLLKQDAAWDISRLPEDWGRSFHRGETAAIDLSRWDESRRRISGMRQDRRQDFNRSSAQLRLEIASGPNVCEALAGFRHLYRQTMERLGADQFFFFADEYYRLLASELGDRFVVISASSDSGPVASSIFLADSRFAHYHLSGSNDEGRRSGAATLVVNAGADWARRRGCSLLHLGGGLKTNDSLWSFKQSFGGISFFYSYSSVIGNNEQYERMIKQAGVPWPYIDVPQPAAGVTKTSGSHDIGPAIHTRKKKIVGIGAGGHAKVIIDILTHYPDIEVVGLVELATRLFGEAVAGSLILGDDHLLPELLTQGVGLAFIGIGGVGNNLPRAKSFERVLSLGFDMINAIHPQAVVAGSARLGRGVCIMAGAVVNPAAEIGDNVILNTHCTVEHDCVVADHVHIAPGATLSGAVRIGKLSHIGTGASVRQGVRIGERAVVGVGSVVVGDVPDDAVVVGSPARSLKVVSRE